MRFLTDITIEQAIAHHLDHLTPEKIFSHRPLKLSAELHAYLTEHVLAVSRLGSVVPARFREEPGEVARACRAILAGEGKLTPMSVQIAERLFTVMGTNRTLSPGLLVVTLVRNNENKQKFVAILKMESQPVFKEERGEGANGEPYIELTIDHAALPAPGRHLQKCALVKGEHTASRPEILLLDKQAGDTSVAGFFREQFLQAEYCRDSHFRTRKFMREFVKWANRARQEHRISPDELDDTVSAAREVLRKQKVSVPEFVQENISKRGEQASCLEHMGKRQVDVQFETEAKASEKFRRIRLIKLDHQAQIRMREQTTLDKDFYKVELDPDDNTVTVITIRSRKYQVT